MGQSAQKLAPTQLNDLCKKSTFSRDELKTLFDKFKKDYPSGYMTKAQFLKMYQDYYASGDSKTFSEHVFRVFDINSDDRIDFREFICSISLTTRGSIDEKLRWAFNIYDVNGDGRVSITEVVNIVQSVQALCNTRDINLSDTKLKYYFESCDQNQDGSLTVEEFIGGSRANPVFMKLLTDYVN